MVYRMLFYLHVLRRYKFGVNFGVKWRQKKIVQKNKKVLDSVFI